MSLSSKITLGLLLGTALGLFLGELARPFEMIGQIYIGLMQMTIVPYIVVSLIGNIGRLSHQDLHLLTGSGLLMYALILIASGASTLVFAESFQDLRIWILQCQHGRITPKNRLVRPFYTRQSFQGHGR